MREAVVDAPAFHVDDGNKVCSIFTDQSEQFLAFKQLTADAMNLQLLVDAVEVEQQHQAGESPDGFLHGDAGLPGFV
jgi:hypothetical protein